jgi:hypothetical protein
MQDSLFYSTVLVVASLLVCAAPTHAGIDLEEGMWRVELNNDFGVHQN